MRPWDLLAHMDHLPWTYLDVLADRSGRLRGGGLFRRSRGCVIRSSPSGGCSRRVRTARSAPWLGTSSGDIPRPRGRGQRPADHQPSEDPGATPRVPAQGGPLDPGPGDPGRSISRARPPLTPVTPKRRRPARGASPASGVSMIGPSGSGIGRLTPGGRRSSWAWPRGSSAGSAGGRRRPWSPRPPASIGPGSPIVRSIRPKASGVVKVSTPFPAFRSRRIQSTPSWTVRSTSSSATPGRSTSAKKWSSSSQTATGAPAGRHGQAVLAEEAIEKRLQPVRGAVPGRGDRGGAVGRKHRNLLPRVHGQR